MYLVQALHSEGVRRPMAGLLPGEITMTERLSILGYYSGQLLQDSIIGSKGAQLQGHAYHWSRFSDVPRIHEWMLSIADASGESLLDGLSAGSCFASYLHMHFAGVPAAAVSFVEAMKHHQGIRIKWNAK